MYGASSLSRSRRMKRFRKHAVVLKVYSVLISGIREQQGENRGETPLRIGAADAASTLRRERKSPVFDASFELCPNSDRTKHSGKNPAMDGIQRVPVDKTAQSRRVENGGLTDG